MFDQLSRVTRIDTSLMILKCSQLLSVHSYQFKCFEIDPWQITSSKSLKWLLIVLFTIGLSAIHLWVDEMFRCINVSLRREIFAQNIAVQSQATSKVFLSHENIAQEHGAVRKRKQSKEFVWNCMKLKCNWMFEDKFGWQHIIS